jgi:hypothetical protein
MAYYSGNAASLTALRDALLAHAQADGWVLTGDVLSKAGVYFQIGLTATNVTCRGCESNALLNPGPQVAMIGAIYVQSGQTTRQISFPCNYEVFGFGQEFYFVVNYDTDSYQWMAFGKSTVPGLLAQGGWYGATVGGIPSYGSDGGVYAPVILNVSGPDNVEAGVYGNCTSAMLFAVEYGYASATAAPARNSWVNNGLDGHGWYPYTPSNVEAKWLGLHAVSQLLYTQPSAWNSEAALLPLQCWRPRLGYKSSLVADLENARHVRVDNFSPGDILTLGADKWKVFPWYRKDATQRNGILWTRINHTGTFGWAIRYEGP